MDIRKDSIVVDDLDKFVKLLNGWHQEKVQVLEHMLTIPEGTEVVFNGEEPKALEGDFQKGFIVGLSTALMELGTLPFGYETLKPEDEPAH